MLPTRRVLLVQLPIPPVGPQSVIGNVPLAAGYLVLHARRQGLGQRYDFEILPAASANQLGDAALIDAIVARAPDLLTFTCYLWNVERSLWIAEMVKRRLPELRIAVGGPEITTDNEWVLASEAVDWFGFGEGEQTFAELLTWWDGSGSGSVARADAPAPRHIAGLAHREGGRIVRNPPRVPLPNIDVISSPYLDGILDAADSETLLLETSRGCIFKCKFCYYPKAYDRQYFLSPELVLANLQHARDRGAKEVFLLDPTLNQRPDFGAFVELLARGNPDRTLEFHAELRGEGLTPKIAEAMARANFVEVEIGLQSIDPVAQELMDRRNNLRAFENGVRALRDVGIRIKVDMIVGLPGDTEETIRRGMHWLAERDLVDDVQVFQLSILPGTAFRKEARELGLEFQDRPPYAVLATPTLDADVMHELVEAAEEIFDTSFDPLPEVWLERREPAETGGVPSWCVVEPSRASDPVPRAAAQVFALWFRSDDVHGELPRLLDAVRSFLADNPFATLLVVVEARHEFPFDVFEAIEAAFEVPHNVYIDRYHEFSPGRPRAARRIALVPAHDAELDPEWLAAAHEFVGGAELDELEA